MKQSLLLILLTLVVFVRSNYITLSVSLTNTTINSVAAYTFLFYRDTNPLTGNQQSVTAVALNSVITLTFPSSYTGLADGSYTCSSGLTCSMSNKVLTVSGYYSTSATLSDTSVTFTVSGIKNPAYTGSSGEFQYTIKSSTGTIQDQSPSLSDTPVYPNAVTLTAGTLASCQISTTGIVYSQSTVTVSITPTNPIPAGGSVIITLPLTWANSYRSDQLISGSLVCSPITNIDSTVSCSYQTTTETVITASGLNANSLASTFSFSMASVTLPPTVNPTDNITMSTRMATGDVIDTCTTTFSGVVAAALQNVSVTATNTTVSKSTTLQVSFINSVLIATADTIKLTVPSTIGMPSLLNITTFTGFTNVTSGNVITLGNFSGNTISANNRITITMFSCTNPSNIKPTDPLTISIERTGRSVQSGSAAYQATAGTLTATLTSTSRSTNHLTASQLAVSIGSPMAIGSYLTMIYPYAAQPLSGSASITQCTVNSIVVSGATYALTSGVLFFNKILASQAVSSGSISLNFSEFTNPPTTQPVSFTISSYSSDGYMIDTGVLSYNATPATITSISIASSSYTVLAVATLTLSFVPSTSYTSVQIITPTDIQISTDQVARSCTSNQPSLSSCSYANNNLTFSSANALSGSTTLSWSNSIMPGSFNPTGKFQVYTYSDGWLVQSSTSLLTLTMNQTAEFTAKTVSMSSVVNSANSSMTVQLTMPSGSPLGTLAIDVPTPVVINSGLTCTINNVAVTCGISGRRISLPVNTATSLVNSIVVSTLGNPPTLQPTTDTLNVSLSDSLGKSSLFSQVAVIQNTQAITLTSATLTTGIGFYGESTNLTVATALNGNQAYVLLTVPSSFPNVTVGSTPCTGCTVPTINQIKFATTSTTLSLLLTLATSKINSTNGFTVETYSSSNYLVQQGTTNSWYPKCASTVCRDCSGTTCLSCYNDTSITANVIFKQSSCVSLCPSIGFFLVGSICSVCDANCYRCDVTSKNCTQCTSSTYLDPTTSSCVTTCPDTYYKVDSTLTCAACQSPCSKCNSSTFCLSCRIGFYLLNNSCLSACPANVYVQNTLTLTCDACSANCLTCANYTFKCTSCDTTKPLYLQTNTSTCVTACTGGLVVKAGVCSPCDSPCLTCSVTTTNCTGCNSTSSFPLLYNSTCIARPCPDKTYANDTTSSCQPCLAECSTCSAATICLTCETNYYYFNSTSCLTVCPNGTFVLNNKFCQACDSTCKTCSNATTCLTCYSPRLLYNGTCYLSCPNGTYPGTTTCLDCINSCQTCLNSTYCLSCVTNSYLYATKCWQPCPNGTFTNPVTLADCVVCPTGCTLCTGTNYCTACQTGYSMENNLCVTSCSVGISHNQVCYPCGLNCANCNYTCTNCTPACSQCDVGYSRYQLYCQATCPQTTVSLSQVCQNCSVVYTTDCLTCNSSQCLTCSQGALQNGSCQPCPSGQFASINNCVQCPSECLTCNNNSYCTTCATSYYLYNFSCSTTCPPDMIPAGAVCAPCRDNCSLCDISTTKCLVCQSHSYVYEGGCVSRCPDNLTVSLNASNCVTPTEFYKEYSQASKVVYFPFTICSVAVLIVALGLKLKWRSMHFFTLAAACISIFEVAVWILFMFTEYDVWLHGHTYGMFGVYCLAVTFGCLLGANLVLVYLFNRYLKLDEQYRKWVRRENHHCSTLAVLSISACLNFKFFRLVYSRTIEKSNFCLELTSINSLRPMNALSIASLFVLTVPSAAGAALAMYYSIERDTEYWVAVDCLVVTILGALLVLVDLHQGKDYFTDEFEAQNVKNVYKLEADNQSDIKVQFEEDEQAEMFNPTMGKTFFKTLTVAGRPKELDEVSPGLARTAQKGPRSRLLNKLEKLDSADNSQNELMGEEMQSHQELIDTNEEGMIGTGFNPSNGSQLRNTLTNNQDISQLEEVVYDAMAYWKPSSKKYDKFGYLIVENEHGQQQRFDDDGYRVVIDGDKHVRYDEEGYRVEKLSNGAIARYDKDGFRVEEDQYGGGLRRYDEEGLEVREVNGQLLRFDQHGFEVRKKQDGTTVRYDNDGYEIRELNGHFAKFDEEGYEVLNVNGKWLRYDSNGFEVRLVDGKLLKFDSNGYEVREIDGKKVRFDPHGFRVERNFYGGVILYDEHGYIVQIDQQGNITRSREDGMRVQRKEDGTEVIFDKRGNKVVFDEQGNYRKFDPEGNQVWLDEFGREVVHDEEGNTVKYDVVGNRVDDEDDIILFQEDEEMGLQGAAPQRRPKEKAINLKKNKQRAIDHEAELMKLFGEEHEKLKEASLNADGYSDMHLSELQDINVDHIQDAKLEDQLNDMLFDQRNELPQPDGDVRPIRLMELEEMRIIPKEELLEKENQLREEQERKEQERKALEEALEAQEIEEARAAEALRASQAEQIEAQLAQAQEAQNQANITSVKPIKKKSKGGKNPIEEGEQFYDEHIVQHPSAGDPLSQQVIHEQVDEPKSVRDADLSEKTEQNQGVEAPEEFIDRQQDESLQLDRNMLIDLRVKKEHSSQSHQLFDDQDIETKTEYKRRELGEGKPHIHSQRKLDKAHQGFVQSNRPTKDKKKGVYDPDEEVESVGNSGNWEQEQGNVFGQSPNGRVRGGTVFNPPRSEAESVILARPVINYIEEEADNNDTLTDYVDFHIEKEKTVKKNISPRRIIPYREPQSSLEVEDERLLHELEPRRRRNADNPLITYAQTLDSDRYESNRMRSIERIYLQNSSGDTLQPKKRK